MTDVPVVDVHYAFSETARTHGARIGDPIVAIDDVDIDISLPNMMIITWAIIVKVRVSSGRI